MLMLGIVVEWVLNARLLHLSKVFMRFLIPSTSFRSCVNVSSFGILFILERGLLDIHVLLRVAKSDIRDYRDTVIAAELGVYCLRDAFRECRFDWGLQVCHDLFVHLPGVLLTQMLLRAWHLHAHREVRLWTTPSSDCASPLLVNGCCDLLL